jgi:hypothetical protein
MDHAGYGPSNPDRLGGATGGLEQSELQITSVMSF